MIEFIVMFVVMVVIAVITALFTVKNRGKSEQFDERQLLARGKALGAGFYTLMLSLLCYIFYSEYVENPILDNSIGIGLCIFVGVAVYAIIGVIKDAFIGFNSSETGKKVCFGLLGGINLALGVWGVLDGRLFEDGKLSMPVLNLGVGVIAIIVCIGLTIRFAQQKKEAAEEADDE